MKISFNVYEETDAPTATATLDPATPGEGRTYSGPVTVKFTSTDPANADPAQPMAGIDYIEHRVILNGVAGRVGPLDQPGPREPVHELGRRCPSWVQLRRSSTARLDRGGNAEADQDGDVQDQPPDRRHGRGQRDRARARSALAVQARWSLGPFIPGVAQTYTATTTATVTSSWPNATLSVYDEDANTNTNGRLVNGASIIPTRLDVLNSTGAYQSIQASNQRACGRDLGDAGGRRERDDHDASGDREQQRARGG